MAIQAAAVAGLAKAAPQLEQVAALMAAVRNDRLFCRVRAAAAVALGATACDDTEMEGVNQLIKYFRYGVLVAKYGGHVSGQGSGSTRMGKRMI